MTYAELAALQAKRSKTFSMAQTDAMAAYCQAEHDLKELQAENAKLRELVRIMHGELVSCEDNGYVCGGHKFDERVRELGIEVDGCE